MKDLPELGSTVRIVSIGLKVWPDAEKFFGADCTLCAVFTTGDTQMVAVEHQADGVCCCFRSDMVRTPEQAAAEERDDFITTAVFETDSETPVEWRKAVIGELYDLGYRKQVAP